MEKDIYKRNKFMFSFGTFGRDMVYVVVNMFLIKYVQELKPGPTVVGAVSVIVLVVGIFDACNDPFMGLVVDNTKSRWGKFKPWIVIGAVLTAILTIVLFSDIFGRDAQFIVLFFIFYLLWTVAWTLNDIAYWSMLPSLGKDSTEREVTTSLARLFASLGTFAAVITVIPVTAALTDKYGIAGSYTVYAAAIVLIMLFTLSFTVFGVKEHPMATLPVEKTGLRDMMRAIFKNDQLLICGIAMIPFAIGSVTTISLGTHYFKYYYGDESMFSVMAVVMGGASLLAIASFPLLCKAFKRKQLFAISVFLLAAGYILFFFVPPNIVAIGFAATLLFVGQALAQVTLVVCLADIVEYGEWKLGKRNESVTFSLQSFISKLSGGFASAIEGFTVIIAGITAAKEEGTPVTEQGIWILKTAMFIIPLLLILIGAAMVLIKYKIDEKFYKKIVAELEVRNAAQIAEAEAAATGTPAESSAETDGEITAADSPDGHSAETPSEAAESAAESGQNE